MIVISNNLWPLMSKNPTESFATRVELSVNDSTKNCNEVRIKIQGSE